MIDCNRRRGDDALAVPVQEFDNGRSIDWLHARSHLPRFCLPCDFEFRAWMISLQRLEKAISRPAKCNGFTLERYAGLFTLGGFASLPPIGIDIVRFMLLH